MDTLRVDGDGVEALSTPQRAVTLRPFQIQQHEVTNAEYRRFDPTYDPDAPGDVAVVNVSWHEASAYAAWLGGRLPSEAQWELAARGEEGRPYPWGEAAPTCDRANFLECQDSLTSVRGQGLEAGATPEGVFDMAGNVSEWCQDWYGAYPDVDEIEEPLGPRTGDSRVIRGGSVFLKPNSAAPPSILGALTLPMLAPGSLSKWLHDTDTYWHEDIPGNRVLIHEEYQFRKSLLLTRDAYIKNDISDAFQSRGGAASTTPAAHAGSRDERVSFQVLADLFSRTSSASFSFLFHMPGMSFGNVNSSIKQGNSPSSDTPYAHMTPTQRHEYAAVKVAQTTTRFFTYPVTGGLGILLNGAWEVNTLNIALVDTVSRSVGSVVSALLESLVQGIVGAFRVIEVYEQEEVAVKVPLPLPPVVRMDERTTLSIGIVNAYENLEATWEFGAFIEERTKQVKGALWSNGASGKLKPVDTIERLAQDVMAYAFTVYGGNSFDVPDKQGIDKLELTSPGERWVGAWCKPDKPLDTAPVLYLVNDGIIKIFPYPELHKVSDGEVSRYHYKYAVNGELEGVRRRVFSNYGSVQTFA